jgi:hypothetical protein
MVDYRYNSSVESFNVLVPYVALNKRVRCACRCAKCREVAWIRSCYKRGDLLVQSVFVGDSFEECFE